MGRIQQWLNHCLARIRRSTTPGAQAEDMACRYLRKHGLQLIAKNYSTKAGEIDLIMLDDQQYVFVEVKHRTRTNWADAAEAVTYHKQQKVIKAAQQYLQQKKLYDQVDCRFDVVAIDGELAAAEIAWLKHAFY